MCVSDTSSCFFRVNIESPGLLTSWINFFSSLFYVEAICIIVSIPLLHIHFQMTKLRVNGSVWDQAVSLGILWVLSWKSTNRCKVFNYNLQPWFCSMLLSYYLTLFALWSILSFWCYFSQHYHLDTPHCDSCLLYIWKCIILITTLFPRKVKRVHREKCQIIFRTPFSKLYYIFNICAVLQNVPHKMMHVQVWAHSCK